MSFNKIPDDYFKNLKNKIIDNVKGLDDNLASEAPILSSIAKDNIYRVPDKYFDQNQAKLLSKVSPKVISLKNMIPLGVAATVLILLGIMIFNPSSDNIEITDDELFAYYIENDNYELETNYEIFDESLTVEDYFDDIEDAEYEAYINNIYGDLSVTDLALLSDSLEDL